MKIYNINEFELLEDINNLRSKGYKVLDTTYGLGGIYYCAFITRVFKDGVILDINDDTKIVNIKVK